MLLSHHSRQLPNAQYPESQLSDAFASITENGPRVVSVAKALRSDAGSQIHCPIVRAKCGRAGNQVATAKTSGQQFAAHS